MQHTIISVFKQTQKNKPNTTFNGLVDCTPPTTIFPYKMWPAHLMSVTCGRGTMLLVSVIRSCCFALIYSASHLMLMHIVFFTHFIFNNHNCFLCRRFKKHFQLISYYTPIMLPQNCNKLAYLYCAQGIKAS